MSGAVNTVKDVGTALSAPMWMAPKAAFNLVAHGTNPMRDVGDSIKTVAGAAKKGVVNPIMQGAGLSQPELPTIAPEDPGAAATAAAQARAAAARQVQIDTLTNKPGRGGTILTDSYQYRV